MTYLFFVLGLVGLFVGGEFLIRGAVALARRLGVSPLVIGLTIVGFGTSAPELLVSVQAAFAGSPDIALGNVLGSNIANILLILGIAAVAAPMTMKFAHLKRDFAVLIGSTVVLWAMLLSGTLSRLDGLLLLTGLAVYLWLSFRAPEPQPEHHQSRPMALVPALLLLVAGLAALMVGANLLVDSATEIARALGISEAVIALTIVAIGTLLPELATSVMAARRGQSDIAVGNIVGSNIFNILGILGTTSLLHPLSVDTRFAGFDIALALIVALAVVALAYLNDKVGRRSGLVMLGTYAIYLVWLGL